jgi:hypothetical protein
MDKTWQLQDAKSRFSELVNRAERGETQIAPGVVKKRRLFWDMRITWN